jgi:protease-4
MLSDEDIVEKVRTWKRMSAKLISQRFKINAERALRVEAMILGDKGGASEEVPVPTTFVLPKKLFMLARPSRLLPYLAIFSILLFLNLIFLGGLYFSSRPSGLASLNQGSFCSGGGNVAVIEITGELVTTYTPYFDENGNPLPETIPQTVSTDVVKAIQEAVGDPSIVAIVLSIDSPGGSPVAAEEIEKAIRSTEKPTVALIRGQGLSAAYWVATGARTIFASALSDVGSIGATASYIDNAEQNKRDGLTYNSISSGKYKDTGDPNKPLSEEERDLILREVNRVHEIFIKKVAENRKQDISVIESLADGSSLLGEEALSVGLIDEIGGMKEVRAYLTEKNNLKNLSTCQYYQVERNY